jgi:predicted alpha/beta superfamily hydrolase
MRKILSKLLYISIFIIFIACGNKSLDQEKIDTEKLEIDPQELDFSEVIQAEKDRTEYFLPNTETRKLKSEINGINYWLYISLPRNYGNEIKDYPVVITLDADYSFAISHNIIEHYVDRNDLPEMILVSIAYEGASQNKNIYRQNRTRDYTPTYSEEAVGYIKSYLKNNSGGGNDFRKFITKELIPFLEVNYRMNDDRTIVGHSFGGLFATYMLLTSPETFNRYIIISPSLWYDDEFCFDLENDYASKNDILEATIFICAGEWENNSIGWPKMADDMFAFVNQMKGHDYACLEIEGKMFLKENHNSIFPGALSWGLRFVFEKM